MLYEHVNKAGDVDERVRPVVGSPNADQLAVKALDASSGWRAVDEAAPESPDRSPRRPRTAPAPANTPEGGALS